MWIGAYEQEGRTSFFAVTSDNASLGPFLTFEKAQGALKAYEEKLSGAHADLIRSLSPVFSQRQTRLGQDTFGHWKISDAVEGMLILHFNDRTAGERYLVVYEDGFIYVDVVSVRDDAIKSASEAAKRKRAFKL